MNYYVLFCFLLLMAWVKGANGQVVLTSSNLPIVCIYTYGQPIIPDTGIVCDMGIIYNGPGEINHITDPFNNYDGKISICKRGNTSIFYPKNSYRFETQDDEGQNLDVSLIDLPEENDWVLYGPYPDKSLMRDVLIYELARRMGWYAPRTKFCEVLLDNGYIGVYVLIEKIKRDNDRIDISKLTPDDTAGVELTGGYIIQIDHWQGAGWHSTFNWNVYFEYIYPDDDEIAPTQESYIQDFVFNFENSLYNLTNITDTTLANMVDFNSFADYVILNEFSKNADAYRLSTYFYKDNDCVDGRLKMGPIWDYNLAFGNYCSYFAYLTENFIYSDTTFWNYSPFWFRKMMSLEHFQNTLHCRWNGLRTGILSEESIEAVIDSCYNFLSEAQVRNFEQWDILGIPVWPNYYYGDTYEEEITLLKDWINGRLSWLDDNLPGECFSTSTGNNGLGHMPGEISINPNPFSGILQLEFYTDEYSDIEFQVIDLFGKTVFNNTCFGLEPGKHRQTINLEHLGKGMYLFALRINDGPAKIKRIIKAR